MGDNIVRVFETQRIQLLLVPWQRPTQPPRPQPQPKPQPQPQPKAERPNPRKRGRGRDDKNAPKQEPKVERPTKGGGKDSILPRAISAALKPLRPARGRVVEVVLKPLLPAA